MKNTSELEDLKFRIEKLENKYEFFKINSKKFQEDVESRFKEVKESDRLTNQNMFGIILLLAFLIASSILISIVKWNAIDLNKSSDLLGTIILIGFGIPLLTIFVTLILVILWLIAIYFAKGWISNE